MKYVVGFMFDERGEEVLLIQKLKPAWQHNKLNGVGGKIEEYDESPAHAMSREFHEETGIHHDHLYWTLGIHLLGPDYEVYFFYTEGNPYLAKHVEKEKPIVIKSWRELPCNVIFNLTWMIPLMRDKSIRLPIIVHDMKADLASTGTSD